VYQSEIGVFHSITFPPDFFLTFSIVSSKAKTKMSGDTADETEWETHQTVILLIGLPKAGLRSL
jgi:hypothetical protein